MGTANGALKADGRRAADDLDRASDHVRDLFPDLSRQVREVIDDGVERLRGHLRDGGKDAAEAAGEGLETARLYVVERVQQRPLTATLAALGVGVFVGLLFAAGSRR